MSKTPHHKQGFGLLEVLMATAVFIIVAGSIVTLSRLTLRSAALATHQTQAFNLAEDALESVRQIRDSNWNGGVPFGTTETTDHWKAFVYDCQGGSATVPVDDNPLDQSKRKPYEVCYDERDITNIRLGLRTVTYAENSKVNPDSAAREPNTYIVLKNKDSQTDPAAPRWYQRYVTFEPVPNSQRGTLSGFQLLGGNGQNQPEVIANAEQFQALKVKVTVTWNEFGKDWSVSSSTILTNWKGK